MCSCPHESEQQLLILDLINQKPVRLDVALSITVIVPYESVITMFWWERFLVDKKVKNCLKFFGIIAAVDRFGIILLKAILRVDVKH